MNVPALDHLDLMTSAPPGVEKLRQLVLQLAVRGALTQRLTSDEPASRAIEALAVARTANSASRSRLRKSESLKPVSSSPYSLPENWQWCTLADLVEVLNGRAYKKEELLDSGTPVLRVGNLFTSKHWYYSDLTLDEEKYCEAGDLIFAWSASFGPFIWSGVRVIYHYHIWKLKPHDESLLYKPYLNIFLKERTQAIKDAGHGVSMAHMTKEKIELLPVALPPLAEQHRIVAKVDELMALCDRLEARQQDAEVAHTQLVQVLLDRLTQAQDAEEFQASWERVAGKFDVLFTTDAAIDALQSAILQLAVAGRLSAQDASDDPASDLLKDIELDALRFCRESNAPRASVEPIDAAAKPFSLPDQWEWVRLGSIFRVVTDGDHQAPPQTDDGVAFLTIGNVTKGSLNFDHCRTVDAAYFRNLAEYRKPKRGDLLYTVVGATYGRPVLVDSDRPFCVQRHIAILKRGEYLDPLFALYLLKSPLVYEQASACTTGTAQPTIPLRPLRSIVVPLPPLAEQHRIVKRVAELLSLCDHLRERSAAARAKHAQLADALVASTVIA